MNKTKTCTRLSALFAVLLAIMIAVPAILQSGADAAVNKKQPTKATLTSAKATSYNKVSLKWKKSKNITSYAVYYKASNSKKWVKIANVSSKKTGYTHKSSKKYPLKQGKTYQYRIRGYNKNAKGSKKYGKYSSTKKVKIPKKAAVKPTEAPNPTVKPTEAPKPTAVPKPTVTPKPTAVPKPTAAPKPTVTPIPKPTAIPKPTQIPQPTKPVQPAKPTATPIPKPTAVPQPTATPKPTVTPAPTATPKPVKVSSITLNQTSLTMTSKGQTASLTATVSPGNAENKNITWSSSNSSVATVNANGTVTAVANGTADIKVTANDGSGVSAKCSVTVKVPNNVRNITLEGGKSIDIGPDRDDINSIDFSKVTFNIQNNNGSLDVLGFSSNLYSASVCVRALKVGNTTIIAKYNGNVLLTYNVTVSSDWQEYLEYVTWRKSIENKIWSSGMSVVNKLDAAKNFIQSHYGYQNGAGAIINVYNGAVLDCYGATELMSDFAKDIELSIKYVNAVSGHIFDYSGYAFSEGGHVYPKILINGNWVNYDATPTHS
ncbi:Ig-like domain-containing protein [bacterium 210702-DFI.5.13]|nr:Ig-like domain-containing protein [bacterium 210702-DFI.5.13]